MQYGCFVSSYTGTGVPTLLHCHEIFVSQGAPPTSTTPAANFAPSTAVDIGGKFATGVNDIDGKFDASVNDTGGAP
jgi:hypothetical protein